METRSKWGARPPLPRALAGVFCLLLSGCGSLPNPFSRTPTFAEDIAPIVFENCTGCHRPGEAAPFSLLTYEDAANRARTIATVTASRYMPPWPADPEYSRFLGERVLTPAQIESIQRWAEGGAPAGDLARMPPAPRFPAGSRLGEPDLTIRMQEPLLIPGDNTDRFMVIKIPYEIPEDIPIRAVEFVPDNPRLVHHMNGHIVQYEDGEKSDPFAGPYVVNREAVSTLEESYDAIQLLNDDGSYPWLHRSVANYLPGGNSAVVYPRGLGGWILKRKGAFLMRDVHYGPSPIDVADQSHFNVFFADAPPARPTMEVQLGTLGISEIVPPLVIPPNEVKTFTTRTVVDDDISLLSITPHMHLLGRSFEAFAVRPDGVTVPLIRIPEWDFRWQYFYTFPKMVKIPRGSTINVIGVFDNTADNPNNPFSPPREIIGTNGSMRVTDEMFQLIMTFLPYEDGDENISLDAALVD